MNAPALRQAAATLLARLPDVRAAGGPPPSPCTSVCRIDAASGWCEGCLRTLDEIAAWSGLAEAGQRRVWLALEERARALEARA